MSLFGDHIAHIGREDLLSHINQLQTFFMTCLNVRIDYPEVRDYIAHIGREDLLSHVNVRIDYPEVRDHIAYIGRKDLLSHINQLQTFCITCRNVRIDCPEVEITSPT